MTALRGHMHAMEKDVNNLYEKSAGIDVRLDRIEKRLDLIGEPAE